MLTNLNTEREAREQDSPAVQLLAMKKGGLLAFQFTEDPG
jgi:hypothetical protein